MPRYEVKDNDWGGPESQRFTLPGVRRVRVYFEGGYYKGWFWQNVAHFWFKGPGGDIYRANTAGLPKESDGLARVNFERELGPGQYEIGAYGESGVWAYGRVEWEEPTQPGTTTPAPSPPGTQPGPPGGGLPVVGGTPPAPTSGAPTLQGFHGLFAPELSAVAPSERSLATEGDVIRIFDFSGGLNLRDHDWLLEPRESPDLLNVRVTPRNALVLRKGYQRLLEVGQAVGPCVRLAYHMFPSGEAYLFAVYDAADGYRLYVHSLDGSFTELIKTWNPKPRRVSFHPFKGYLYCAAAGYPILRISHGEAGVTDIGVAELREAWINLVEEPFDKDWPGQWMLTEDTAWWSHTVITESSAQYGQWVLCLSAKSGAQLWPVVMELPVKIPIAGSKLYVFSITARAVSGTNNLYMGARAYAADGETPINTNGSSGEVKDNLDLQHWFGAKYAVTPALGWVTYTGYAQGFASTGTSTPATDPANPGRFHEKAAFFSPLVVWYPTSASDVLLIDVVLVRMKATDLPRPGFLSDHSSRMVGAFEPLKPRSWFFSELHNAEVWSTYREGDATDVLNEDEINEGSGEEITGLAKVSGGLLLFTDTDTFLLSGITPDQWRVTHLASDLGCIAPGSVAVVGGRAIWLSHRGVVMGDADGISDPPISAKIQPELDAYTVQELSRAVGVATTEHYYLFLPRRGSATPDRLEVAFVYDLRRGTWWRDEGYKIRSATLAIVNNELAVVAGSADESLVYRLEYGTTDDGAPVTGYWKSQRFFRETQEAYRRLSFLAANRASWDDKKPAGFVLEYESASAASVASVPVKVAHPRTRIRLPIITVSSLAVKVMLGGDHAPDLEGFVLESRQYGRWRRR